MKMVEDKQLYNGGEQQKVGRTTVVRAPLSNSGGGRHGES